MFRAGTPWPHVFAGLPVEFHANLLHEPAFDTANSTFCVWRRAAEARWPCAAVDLSPGEDPEGSAALLAIFAGQVDQYVEFAGDYYETDIAPADVAALYHHDRLTGEFVGRLNPDADLRSLAADIDEIAYPESG
jgi:hypothetical protein